MFEVLKDFFYSTDGVTSVLYSAGETQSVNNDLSPGLISEGFIADPAAPVETAPAKKSKK